MLTHKELLARAYLEAAKSPDPSCQNGALVVSPTGHIVTVACNEFPPKVQVTENMLSDRVLKLQYIEHAERHALFKAARFASLANTTLVCPWLACADCARAIVLMGVARVICHRDRMLMTPQRWVDSVATGLSLIITHGVELVAYRGKINGCPILVNGERWEP